MKHDIQLTSASKDRLNQLAPKTYHAVIDGLDNPLLRDALSHHRATRLFMITNTTTTWMTIDCRENNTVDIAFWKHDAGDAVPMNPALVKIAEPLPKQACTPKGLECDRAYATLAQMAWVMWTLQSLNDKTLYMQALQTFSQVIPRAKYAMELAQQLHGSHADEVLVQTLKKTNFFVSYTGKQFLEHQTMPVATGQVLITMHASVHRTEKAALYALDHPTEKSTFLLVIPENEEVDSRGVHLWLSAKGVPLIMNGLRKGNISWWTGNPDEPLLNWSTTSLPGPCSLQEHQRMHFNSHVEHVCSTLAESTPRELRAEQVHDVVNAWLNSGPSMVQLWNPRNNSDPQFFQFDSKCQQAFNDTMQLWVSWVMSRWNEMQPKGHAVLENLLEPANDIHSMEEWRQAMKKMTHTAAPEVFDVTHLVEQWSCP